MKKPKLLSLPLLASGVTVSVPATTYAHCPLCVGGAGAAAGIAAVFGVTYGAIGVFIGAFSVAMALWVPRFIRKKYFPYQDKIVAALVYTTTLIPLLSPFQDYTSVYVDMGGEYGTITNQTHLIDLFIVGAIVGTAIVLVAPYISRQITAWRAGRLLRFQGLLITFTLLTVAAVGVQWWSR